MSEIRDIQPMHPLWPARQGERAGNGRKQKRQPQDDGAEHRKDGPEDRDDGLPHVDEYA